ALEDAIDVAGRPPVHVDIVGPIGDKAACRDEDAVGVDRREFVSRGQRDDPIAIDRRQPAACHDKPATTGLREGCDGVLDPRRIAYVAWSYLYPERRRHGLDHAELGRAGGYLRIAKDRRTRRSRSNLLEQVHPFSAQAVFEQKEPGDAATRPRETLDESGA